MQNMILRERTYVDMPEVNVKQGEWFYLVYDGKQGAFWVVRWDRVKWRCSCKKSRCEHCLMVNTFLTEKFMKDHCPVDHQAVQAENDLRHTR